MAFWSRSKPEQRDPEFDFLTAQQGARFRELARATFAEAGVEVIPHAQHLEASDGRQFGLWNLAAQCAQAPRGERQWREIVSAHVATTLRGIEGPAVADLSDDEVLANVYLRVMGHTTLPPDWRQWYSYARPLAGDLIELLALDLPDTVTLLGDEDVTRIGEERLREAGRRNLLRSPVESYEVAGEPGAGALHLVEGESFFTASKLLELGHLLQATWGKRDLPYGVVVSVPIRHMVAFHPIEGVDVLDAVQRLTGLTASMFNDTPGGVSPFVYWWRDGELTQISAFDDEDKLQVLVDGELSDVLNELSARS
ncbi:MAG TPA: hypothetical protein VLB29_19225 [Nocardioidaceae bacterium]|nr:hypothetical protein [Nocardioidaceae bacterium]